jgi:hypothetical protein
MNGAAVLQDWSTSATFASSTLLAASYSVTVEVSTANSGWTAQATSNAIPYVINYPPATGVTLVASPANVATSGALVTFTASGSSTVVLPPAAYQYQFQINIPGVGWTVAQDWSSNSTFQWTAGAAGNYIASVVVRTDPTRAFDTYLNPAMPYLVK